MNKVVAAILLVVLAGCSGRPQAQDQPTYEYEDDYDGTDERAEAAVDEKSEAVVEEPPIFVEVPKTITAREGEDVEMSCATVKQTQHVLIFKKEAQGSKKEVLINVGTMKVLQDKRIENVESKVSTFRIRQVKRTDAGTYICHYQSSPETELKYELDIQYPATVSSKTPKEQRVEKGSSVTIECSARGNPMPKIRWSKENGRLPSGSETEEGFSMTLEDVDRHVEGTYTCTADNGIGEPASSSMKIFVEYPPEISTEQAIVRTGEGDKVELVCIVHSRPNADVYWTKDGEALPSNEDVEEMVEGHRHFIKISNVMEEHFGSYQCDARNDKGSDVAIINLTDLPKQPHFTSPATSAQETSYTLAWETESYYPITEYIIKYRLAKANDSTDEPGEWIEQPVVVSEKDMESDGLTHKMKHVLNDLLPATDYQAIVSVKNKFRWSNEGNFNFSTRKAAPTTIATSTITTSPPLINDEEKTHSSVETVSSRTTAGSGFLALNVAVCITSIVISLIS